MSTLKVDTIQKADGTGSLSVPAESGTVVTTASPSLGRRNLIINGAMQIDQRGVGTQTVNASGLFTVDRWQANQTATGKFSVGSSTTAPDGFVNSYLATSLSAYSVSSSDIFFFNQHIEGSNAANLAWGTANAKTVTLSFWVRSSLTGTFGGCLANSAHNRSYPFTYTISSADTWEQKSVTIAGDTSGTWLTTNGVGVQVIFGLGGGSTRSGTAGSWQATNLYTATGATSLVGTSGATFYLTGVQLEVGSVATPFEHRSYGEELALCQRYYYKTITGSAFSQVADGSVQNGTSHYFHFPLGVTMRSHPSSISFSGVGSLNVWGAAVIGLSSLTDADSSGTNTTHMLLNAVPSSSVGSAGDQIMLVGANDANGYVAFDAEL